VLIDYFGEVVRKIKFLFLMFLLNGFFILYSFGSNPIRPSIDPEKCALAQLYD